MDIFRQKLVPMELARVTEGQKWLREPSTIDYRDHLQANLRYYLQEAARQTLESGDLPNMARAAEQSLKEATRYKAALELLEQMMSTGSPFQTIQ